jgi:membrane fusion protein (multidrug efflux system)
MNKIKLIIAYIFLVLAVLTSCKSQKKTAQIAPPVPVVLFTVQPQNVIYYDTYPGTAVANDEVQIRSEVSGFVTGIYFKEGGHVDKGTKLYEIDRRKYQAAYEAAKANVEIANANLQKAQRDADRYKKLDEQNAIAKQVLDDALTGLKNTQMQVRSSKATLLNAETDFNYSLIKAPFGGSIGLSQVKPGAFIASGTTLLNTLSSDDPIAIDFIIDEKSLPYLIKLQKTKPDTQDSTFRITLPDNSDYKFNGKLSIIDRAVDPQTGTIKIRTIFPNPDKLLRPGMNCKLKVLNEYSGMQINIPFRAIVEQMGEYFVYLINPGDTVKQKRIDIGPAQGEFVVVKNGLNPGDKIVLEGIQKVHQGTVVTESNKANPNQSQSGHNNAKQSNGDKDKSANDNKSNDRKVNQDNEKNYQTKGGGADQNKGGQVKENKKYFQK